MSDRPTPRRFRATDPADLLALVPVLFGFHPEESVVLLSVGGGQPFHARADLPPESELAGLAGYLAGVAVQHGGDRFVTLVYTDDPEPAEAFAAALHDRLVGAGLRLVCAVRADGRRWWWLGRPGSKQDLGTPYDLSTHRFTAEAVFDGTVVHGSRAELAASLVCTDEAEAAVIGRQARAATARWCALDGQAAARARARWLLGELRWVRRRVARQLRDGERLDVRDAGRLAGDIAASIALRDAAWSGMSRDNATGHVELWRDLVRRVPAELRAAPAALLAFAAWLAGDGALAWCAVERSQEAEPGYGLAGLVAQALAGAVPPTAWTPLVPSSETLLDEGLTG